MIIFEGKVFVTGPMRWQDDNFPVKTLEISIIGVKISSFNDQPKQWVGDEAIRSVSKVCSTRCTMH